MASPHELKNNNTSCKLFFKEHFVELLDEINASFNEFIKMVHVHDDTARHPMSDVDFVNFARSTREFVDLIHYALIEFFKHHPEGTELLKKATGHEGHTLQEILKSLFESFENEAAKQTMDKAKDEL